MASFSNDLEIYRDLVRSFEILYNNRSVYKMNNDGDEQRKSHNRRRTLTDETVTHLIDKAQTNQNVDEDDKKDERILNDETNKEIIENKKDMQQINNKKDMDSEEEFEEDGDFGAVVSVEKLKSDHFKAIVPKKEALTRQRSEEEVIGKMRYIYDVDEHGMRTFVRRKSLSKISGTGYSLQ